MQKHKSVWLLIIGSWLPLSGLAIAGGASATEASRAGTHQAALPVSPAPQTAAPAAAKTLRRVGVKTGDCAPNFSLADANGKKHSLSEFAGRPVVLCFFCGCTSCHALAKAWGALQKADPTLQGPSIGIDRTNGESAPAVLTPSGSSRTGAMRSLPPVTIVVSIGNGSEEANQFADDTGLYRYCTVVLPDPMLAVSTDAYHVDPCPRVFVLDADGIIRYTNDHADDNGQTVAGAVIIKRALAALSKVTAPSGS